MLNLDIGTFGKSKAISYLTDLLNQSNDQKLVKKVANILNPYHRFVKEIINCNLPEDIKLKAIELRKDYYIKRIKDDEIFPEIIKNLLRNIIIAKYRNNSNV